MGITWCSQLKAWHPVSSPAIHWFPSPKPDLGGGKLPDFCLTSASLVLDAMELRGKHRVIGSLFGYAPQVVSKLAVFERQQQQRAKVRQDAEEEEGHNDTPKQKEKEKEKEKETKPLSAIRHSINTLPLLLSPEEVHVLVLHGTSHPPPFLL